MQCAAIIVAAGRGERLKGPLRKALVPLGGRPLLVHALELFAACPEITETVLVVHADDVKEFRSGPSSAWLEGLPRVTLAVGGARRQDSVLAGCRAVSPGITGVMIHDAARPFATGELVARLAAALDSADAAVPVVPVTSTVKRIDPSGRVVTTVDRSDLRLAQTPQAARLAILVTALERAGIEGREVTDDVQAIEIAGGRVLAVGDSPANFKITTPADLELARILIERRDPARSGE